MSKKLSFLIIACITLLQLTSCKDIKIPSHWTYQPIQIDGKFNDWAEIPTSYFEEENVVLGLANDSDNLYIIFRFRDMNRLRTVKTSGITIWLNSAGNKNKDFMVRYRGGPSYEEIRKIDSALLSLNSDSNKLRRFAPGKRNSPNIFTCFVKNRIIEKEIHTDGTNGPSVAYGIEQGFCVYEFSIPLKESEMRYYGINADPGKTVGVGIKLSELSKRGTKQNNYEFGQRRGNGKGGGMGKGGGRRGGFKGNQQRLIEEKEIWIKTILAVSDSTEQTVR